MNPYVASRVSKSVSSTRSIPCRVVYLGTTSASSPSPQVRTFTTHHPRNLATEPPPTNPPYPPLHTYIHTYTHAQTGAQPADARPTLLRIQPPTTATETAMATATISQQTDRPTDPSPFPFLPLPFTPPPLLSPGLPASGSRPVQRPDQPAATTTTTTTNWYRCYHPPTHPHTARQPPHNTAAYLLAR